MRFESHIPKSLAMRKSFFASDAKTHSLDLKSQENARKKTCENPAMLACDARNRGVLRSNDTKCLRFGLPLRFGLRHEHLRCQLASDVGRAMRATKGQGVWNEAPVCTVWRSNFWHFPVIHCLRIYPYPMVWPLPRPWSETMVLIPL